MAGPPSRDRATAALIVSVVLLVGGFGVFGILLWRLTAGTVTDTLTLMSIFSFLGGLLAAISLCLRYWFPSK